MFFFVYPRAIKSRVPRGTRGLKQAEVDTDQTIALSRPAWDAGIETSRIVDEVISKEGRVPRGTRGLKQR